MNYSCTAMKFKYNIIEQNFWRVGLLFLVVMIGSSAWSQVFQLNDAASLKDECNCIELTPNIERKKGSAWNLTKLDLSEPFDLSFKIYLGVNSNSADGMAFVLQRGTFSQTSDVGDGLGYEGVSPSLGVLLDTEHNGGEGGDPTSFFGSIKHNHISLHKNGGFEHGSDPDQLVAPTTNFANNWLEDGNEHDFRVTWDPTTSPNIFSVSVDGTELINYEGDIINEIFGGDPIVTWGFTAASGQKFSEKYFCTETLDFEPIENRVSISTGDEVDFAMFDNIYSGTVDSYSWEFGDVTPVSESGTNSSISKPKHTYFTTSNTTAVLTFNLDGACELKQEFKIDLGVSISASEMNVCPGEEFDLTIVGSASDVTASPSYSGTLVDGVNTISLTQTTTFTIDNGTTSDNVTVTVPNARNLTVNNPSDVCDGASVAISTPQMSLSNYQWQAGTNGAVFVDIPQTSPSFNYTNLPIGDYFVRYFSENGSCADTSTVASFSVIENPVLSISSTATTCSYDDASITITTNGTLNTLTDPDASISLNTGSNFVSLTDTTEFTVESEIGICSVDTTFKVNVVGDVLPTIDVIDDDQCIGLVPELNISNSMVSSVKWQVSHDGTTFMDTMGTAKNYVLTGLPFDDYYFRALNTHDGCTDTSAVEYFRVYQALTLEVDAPASVCADQDFELEITHTGNLNVTSTPTFNGPLSSGVNDISLSNSTDFDVTVSQAGCVNDTSISIAVLPSTSIFQEDISDECEGDEVVVEASRSDLINYQWQVSHNNGGFNDTLSDSFSHTLTDLSIGGYQFRYVSNIGGCDNTSDVKSFEVKSKPDLNLTGPATICEGQTANINVVFDGGINVVSTPTFSHTFVNGINVISPSADVDFVFTATENGCDSLFSYSLEVEELIPVSIGSVENGCGEDKVLTANTTNVGAITWQVAHGDVVFNDTLGTNTSYVLSDLGEGPFDFRVTNLVNGCLNTSSVESFTNYNKPSLNVTGPLSICEGETATLEVSSTGSLSEVITPAYAHDFENGMNDVSPSVTTSFEIKATENSCDSVFTFNLGVVPLDPLTVANISDVCEGEEVLLSANQKSLGAYNWQVSHGSGVFVDTLQNASDIILTDLPAGEYEFRYQSGSCLSTSDTISFAVNNKPSLNITGPTSTCDGERVDWDFDFDGIITFTSSSSFTQDFMNGSNPVIHTEDIDFTFTAQENTCDSSFNYSLEIIELVPISISPVNNACGEDLSLVANTSTSGVLSWQVAHGDNVFNDTLGTASSYALSDLGEGVFDFRVTNFVNGCLNSSLVESFTNYDKPDLNVTGPIEICEGETAILAVSSTGTLNEISTPTYTHDFVNGMNDVSPSVSTVFEITASENNCDSVFAFNLGVVPKDPLTVANISDVCEGEEVLLSANQKSLGTYNWQVSHGDGVFVDTLQNASDIVLIDLAAGVYEFRYQSGNCSSTSDPVSFQVKRVPKVTVGSDSISCPNTDHFLTTDFGEGIGAIFYPRGFNDGVPASDFNFISSGLEYNLDSSYLIIVESSLNDCYDRDTVNLRVIETNEVTISGVEEICSSDPESLDLEGDYTNPEWSISRNSSAFKDTLAGSSTMGLSSLSSGNYLITATVESNGCRYELIPHVLEVFDFTTFAISSSLEQCLGSNSRITLSGSKSVDGLGSSGVSYRLDPGINEISFSNTEKVIFSTGVGSCAYRDSIMVEVYDLTADLTSPQVNSDGDIQFEEGMVLQGDVTTNTHPFPLSYTWEYNDLLISTDPLTISESISEPGLLKVKVVSSLCNASDSLVVLPLVSTEFTIPELFTPNGDGDNDLFVIDGLDLSQDHFITIKNRWGTSILERQKMTEFWDGNFKGNAVPEGTYFYILEVADKKISGYVTVLR